MPDGVKPPTAVTKDEIDFILETTLKPHHRIDVNVLRFINEFVDCRSPTEAARRIGLPKPHTAGRLMLQKKDIWKAIESLTSLMAHKFGYVAEDPVERVKDVMLADPIECQNDDGTWKMKLSDYPHHIRMAIKKMKVINKYEKDPNGIDIVVGQVLELEFHDRLRASEMLANEKGALKKTSVVEHDVGKNAASILLGAEQRALLATSRDVTDSGDE